MKRIILSCLLATACSAPPQSVNQPSNTDSPTTAVSPSSQASPKSEPEKVLDAYLQDLATGGAGEGYWCPNPAARENLIAVKSFKILRSSPGKGEAVIFKVQVESSNQAGSPITQNWGYIVTKQQGKFCVYGLLK